MSHPAWSIANFYYCLNLEPNVKRWGQCVDEFIRVGLDYVERIPCIEGPDRFISFNHSHYDTIKKGYETGMPFCIFEDDVVFDNYKRLEEATKQLPDDWDLLYLGANITGYEGNEWQMPVRVSDNLVRLYNCWMTHAIVYSNKMAKWVLDNFNPDHLPVYDEWLRVTAMQVRNVYLINPMIVAQRPGYSDVWKADVEYGSHKEGNKWMRENI